MLRFANLAFLLTQKCKPPNHHKLAIKLSLLLLHEPPFKTLTLRADFVWVLLTYADPDDADHSAEIRYVNEEIEVRVPNKENKAMSPVDIKGNFCDRMSYTKTGDQLSWRCEQMNP